MNGTWWRLLIGAALLVGQARGEEADLSGEWRVSEPAEAAGAQRQVRVEEQGRLALELSWPGERPVLLRGEGDAQRLELQGDLAVTGAVRVLEEARAPEPRPVRLAGRPLPPLEEGGPERLEALLSEGGRVVRKEVWIRPRALGVELIALSDAEWFDPKRVGPLRIEYEVRGRPQALRFRILLPLAGKPGAAADPREAFYLPQLPASGRELELCSWTLDEQPVGRGSVDFDGRDATPAKRILLQGSYVLRVESLTIPAERDEQQFQVAKAHAEFVSPRWMQRVYKGTPDPGVDARGGAVTQAFDGLQALGFRPHARVTTLDHVELAEALARSAQVTISTHGQTGALALYLSRPEELTARPVPAEDPARVLGVGPGLLQAALAREGPRPLEDLHVALVWACLSGSDGGAPGARPEVGQGSGIPTWLIQAGCDVVVAFNELIFRDQFRTWLPRVLGNLAGTDQGVAPGHGVRSLGWAVREAAAYSDSYWCRFTPRQRAAYRQEHIAPLSECVRVLGGPGIDPQTETLFPPRYGNSKN